MITKKGRFEVVKVVKVVNAAKPGNDEVDLYYDTSEFMNKIIVKKSNITECLFKYMITEDILERLFSNETRDDNIDETVKVISENMSFLQNLLGIKESTLLNYLNIEDGDSIVSLRDLIQNIKFSDSGRIQSKLVRSPRAFGLHVNNWNKSLLKDYLDSIDFDYDDSNLNRSYNEFEEFMLLNNNKYPNMQNTLNEYTGYWSVVFDESTFKYKKDNRLLKEEYGRIFAIRWNNKKNGNDYIKVLFKLPTENKSFYAMFNDLIRDVIEFENWNYRDTNFLDEAEIDDTVDKVNICVYLEDEFYSRSLIINFGERINQERITLADQKITFVLENENLNNIRTKFFHYLYQVTANEAYDTKKLSRRDALVLMRRNTVKAIKKFEDNFSY